MSRVNAHLHRIDLLLVHLTKIRTESADPSQIRPIFVYPYLQNWKEFHTVDMGLRDLDTAWYESTCGQEC